MRSIDRRIVSRGVGASLTGLLLAACVSSGGGEVQRTGTLAPIGTHVAAQSSPVQGVAHDAALDPATSPADLPKDLCGTYVTTTDRVPPNLTAHARNSIAVVFGSITDIGNAQWNTPDGQPPIRPDLEASRVMRFVRLEVEATLSGKLSSGVVALPGGSVGCGVFLTDLIPSDIAPGYEGLFFVSPEGPRSGATGVQVVYEVWPVTDGLISVPGGQKLTIAEATAQLSS